MYVNKKLAGVAAVQTLSRLNRTAERKSQADLAIIDFVNEAEEIKAAFYPYFEQAATLPSDPNLLYTAQSRVMSAQLLVDAEMQRFAEAFIAADAPAAASSAARERLHAELYRHLAPAVERFGALRHSDDEDEQQAAEEFRADLTDYVRKYGFLAQIVPYADAELERLYLYGRHLLNRLPRRNDGGVDIGEVDLSHLRVEKTGEHDVGLVAEGEAVLHGFGDGTTAGKDPERSLLSELIDRFNERFGTDFSDKDLIKPFTEAVADPKVRLAAVANDEDNFGHVFDDIFEVKMIEHFDTVADLGRQYFGQNKDFRSSLNRSARRAAWRMIRREEGIVDDAA